MRIRTSCEFKDKDTKRCEFRICKQICEFKNLDPYHCEYNDEVRVNDGDEGGEGEE